MAIPPINTNNPLLRLFKSDPQNAESQARQDGAAGPDNPQDIVEISEAAQQKLDGVKSFSAPGEVQDAAHETREILENSDYTLAGDQDFSKT